MAEKVWTTETAWKALDYRTPGLFVCRVRNGNFEFRFSFSQVLNALLSNKTGQITGIMEVRTEDWARITRDVKLAKEVVAKARAAVPDWTFLVDEIEQAEGKLNERLDKLRAPIQPVVDLLHPDFKLFPFQNEFVRFIEMSGGNCLVGAEMGCVDGDAIVTVNRGGCARRMKLSELYRKFHGGTSVGGKGQQRRWDLSIPTKMSSLTNDSCLVLNDVVDVLDKGVRPVFEVTVMAGRKKYRLQTTDDHEFKTPQGWSECKDLKVGDSVLVNGVKFCPVCKKDQEVITYKYAKFYGQCRYCVSTRLRSKRTHGESIDKDGYVRVFHNISHHPRKSTSGVYKHILVMEAHLSGLSYKEYMDRLDLNQLDGLKFVDQSIVVHHKNENKADFSLSNLEMVSHSKHNKTHLKIKNIRGMTAHVGRVVSIKPIGERPVYDIVMADPFRNFIANGIIVHNCGKTPISLSWIAIKGLRALVVCPKVVRRTWVQEGKKFYPTIFNDFNSLELSPKSVKKYGVPDLSSIKLASVNFASLGKFTKAIEQAGFDVLVIDESHTIKSENTLVTETVFSVAPCFKYKILLSGTAIKNKKEELYTQVELIRPGFFESKEALKCATIGGTWNKMQSFYKTMSKAEVLPDLPPKLSSVLEVDVPGCPDYRLSDGISFEDIAAMKSAVAIAKTDATIDVIRELLSSSDSNILVFSDSVEVVKKVYEELGSKLCILHHGQLSDDAREKAKADFQKEDCKQRVFSSTRQSLAVGATLTRADKVVFSDLPWTPADIRQAEDRTHRIGQVNPVNVYWVKAANNNWDNKVIGILKTKYELSRKILEGKQISPEEREWMEKPLSLNDLKQ